MSTNLAVEHGLDGTYPETWDDFIGQEPVKRQLRVAAQSALMRNASWEWGSVTMEHTLLASGESGIGKTTLALLTAGELGGGLKIVSGRMTQNEARIALSTMQDRDILFIDEIHQLVSRGKANAEWLLHLLQDGVLMGPFGPEGQPNITVIAATTEVGKLPDTIVNRFGLQPPLKPYTDTEGALIAERMSLRILPPTLPDPGPADLAAVARAANNNPRLIGSILSNVRDIGLVEPGAVVAGNGYDLTEPLAWLGLSPDGLTEGQREYLRVLFREFSGQAGEKPLAERLGEPGGIRHIEAPLLKRGYVARTKQGRVLTGDGIHRARQEVEHANPTT